MGYSPSLFWNSSILEIYDLMESYNRRERLKTEEYEAKLKVRIMLNSILARQIGEYVACLFSKDAQVTPIDKLFPGIFKTEELEDKKVKNDLALYKAKMDDFAFRHNQRLKGKEE